MKRKLAVQNNENLWINIKMVINVNDMNLTNFNRSNNKTDNGTLWFQKTKKMCFFFVINFE